MMTCWTLLLTCRETLPDPRAVLVSCVAEHSDNLGRFCSNCMPCCPMHGICSTWLAVPLQATPLWYQSNSPAVDLEMALRRSPPCTRQQHSALTTAFERTLRGSKHWRCCLCWCCCLLASSRRHAVQFLACSSAHSQPFKQAAHGQDKWRCQPGFTGLAALHAIS